MTPSKALQLSGHRAFHSTDPDSRGSMGCAGRSLEGFLVAAHY